MKNLLLIIFSFLFVIVCSTSTVKAADTQFKKTANITYELQDDFSLKANYSVTITNKESLVYAPSFTLSLKGFSPKNLTVFESGATAKTQLNDDGSYKVIFKNPAVGVGAYKKIVFNFTDSSVVDHTDQMTSLRIPQLDGLSDFNSVDITLRVPVKLAEDYNIQPTPGKVSDSKGYKVFEFTKENLLLPIVLDIGRFQEFSYKITYPLSGFQKKDGAFVIPFPPDTSYQRVSIQKISEKPDEIVVDSNGNWLARYQSLPKSDISVEGAIRVFEKPYREDFKLTQEQINTYLKSTNYWQSDDEKIKEIANGLSSPKDIYNYVVKTLKYNFTKTNRPATRLGAVNALSSPNEAICMEFTDLFIALSRAKGIPAREINGYAYTTNPEIQPLSLVSDILHAWPEYWDFDSNTWIPVDPTWGSTTNGIDYFSKFDAKHIAFVIHGDESMFPQTPGTVFSDQPRGKLIYVERKAGFSDKSNFISNVSISGFPILGYNLHLNTENTGEISFLPQNINVRFSDTNREIYVPLIPPLGKLSTVYPEKVPLNKIPRTIEVEYDGKKLSLTVNFTPVYVSLGIFLLVIALLSVCLYITARYAYYRFSIRG